MSYQEDKKPDTPDELSPAGQQWLEQIYEAIRAEMSSIKKPIPLDEVEYILGLLIPLEQAVRTYCKDQE